MVRVQTQGRPEGFETDIGHLIQRIALISFVGDNHLRAERRLRTQIRHTVGLLAEEQGSVNVLASSQTATTGVIVVEAIIIRSISNTANEWVGGHHELSTVQRANFTLIEFANIAVLSSCLLYTSDAADE